MYEIESLLGLCEAISNVDDTTVPAPSLDPARFSAFRKAPQDIPEEMRDELAALVDGKYDVAPPGYTGTIAAPSTADRIASSIAVIYITCDGLPVAVSTLVDPTGRNYAGFVPVDIYSEKSGYGLAGRVQQDFFVVMDEYRNMGLGAELRAQVNALGVPTFIVADSNDQATNDGLGANGYKLISQFELASNESPVNLWISVDTDNP